MSPSPSASRLSTMPTLPLTKRVLVVDDHAPARDSMAEILRHSGYQVQCVTSAVEALNLLNTDSFDVIITDLQMPGMNGLEFIRQLSQRDQTAQVVMVTAYASVATAVDAMRHGAFDYIEKPFSAERLEQLVWRAYQHGQLLDQTPRAATASADEPAVMIGTSPAMQALKQRIARVAPTQETVLICGESGTGKELVARSVHAGSSRAQTPLVSLNCPVLSAHLMESELFGHERGAFTGAETARTGRFELAEGGTILLDEITEIELPLQAKLLRVLQERSFERVGSSQTIEVDVRVLATTNRDLRAEIAAGTFREDLYYRLAVVPLEIPPLRQRKEDIVTLCRHFLHRAAQRLDRAVCQLQAGALDLLQNYHWPGNVRELENLITRACVLNSGLPITADELRPWLLSSLATEETEPTTVPVGLSLHEMERQLIEATLESFGGHREKTAKALGIGIRTLTGKLRTYGYAPRANSPSKAA